VSDPDRAQIIWDGIKTVRAQKQIPALPRLSRYMNRNYKTDKDTTQRMLDLAVEDNLVKLHKKVGTKGNKAGVEEDAYRLPTEDMLPYERHDWYCFHCHAGGEVVLCRDCHRVYHQSCIKQELCEATGFICNFCRSFSTIPSEYVRSERQDLNQLLQLATTRLKEKMPGSILSRAPPPPAKNPYLTGDRKATMGDDGVINSADREAFASFGEEKWRAKFLLKRHIDLDEVIGKCGTYQYRVLDEYKADIQNIVHNVVIYHGVHSAMADQARQIFRDCVSDISELSTCRDCYRYANTRGDKHWFAKPCRPFHEIVYAKQKSFPYWPAKVLTGQENSEGQLEVRFFGGFHQRAVVEKHHIKPITTNIHTLQIKRTSAWNKASEELKRYEELLEKCKNKPEFLTDLYGDPFDGEKVSQLTTSQGEDSESESEEDQHREPGEPGTSLPAMVTEAGLLASPAPLLTPVQVLPRPLLPATARQPTKLRRIEPKPVPGEPQPQPQSQQQQQHSAAAAVTVPLTFVTVPQLPQQQFQQLLPQQPQLQQQQLQQQLQLQQQQIQIQSPLPAPQQPAIAAQILQSPQHVDPAHQQQLLSPTLQQPALQPQLEVQLQAQEQHHQQTSHSPPAVQQTSKKEEKRKERQKQQELVKEVKEEWDADDAVSSSSHVTRFMNASVQTPNKLLRMVAEEICGQSSRKPHADRDFKEYAEKLRAEFEQEKKRAINVATRSLERDLERARADHTSELESQQDKHRQQLSETKKKQWCYDCEAEAIYWCCWNTAYCSQECQQAHWTREHKRNCKRPVRRGDRE